MHCRPRLCRINEHCLFKYKLISPLCALHCYIILSPCRQRGHYIRDATHCIVRALIHSRLDYWNTLFASLPSGQTALLQCVLHAACPACSSTTSLFICVGCFRDTLHWLCFPQHITYKLCLITYKYLQRLAPTYLSHCCVPLASVPGRRQLYSVNANKVSTPQTLTSTLGPRSLSVSEPAAWNARRPWSVPSVIPIAVFSVYWQWHLLSFLNVQIKRHFYLTSLFHKACTFK